MRASILLGALLAATQASSQAIVTSPAPDHVAVTIYRDPNRGARPFNTNWLGGYALVSETRHIQLPAGESELRFEGVTAGLVPQTAIVTGLGSAVLEKNRDARLLSPGGLLDASLGQRLILRRTIKHTGKVLVEDAIVRATREGIVIQTATGIEALKCTGLSQTLLARSVPPGLVATPALSVRVHSAAAQDRMVTLSYITNNFDWQANYIADLSTDGRTMRLFGWVTIGNGDDTALTNAATQAVAGKLNRNFVYVEAGEASPISMECWPLGRTDQIEDQEARGLPQLIIVTGARTLAFSAPPAPPPPPPPPPVAAAKVMASEERLGDVRLYRIPIAITVAAHSQKQVAMLDQPEVKVTSILRLRPGAGRFAGSFERLLRTRNTAVNGLGLALPAGKLELFQTQNDRRLLIGEGQLDDHALGEKVELSVGESASVQASQTPFRFGKGEAFALTVTNFDPDGQPIEVELPLSARIISGGVLKERDGWKVWQAVVPRNGKRELRYRIAGDAVPTSHPTRPH